MKTYICLEDFLRKAAKLLSSYDRTIDRDAQEAVQQAMIIAQSLPRLVREDALEQITAGYTLDQYQHDAARTINEDLTQEEQKIHAVLGLCSEAGQVAGVFQKIYQGHPFDKKKLASQLGDSLWCIAEQCTANDISMQDVSRGNIQKLLIRYPGKFSADRSVNREKYGVTDEQLDSKL